MIVSRWSRLKVQKGHTKVNIKLIQDFDVKKITVNLENTEELSHSQGSLT